MRSGSGLRGRAPDVQLARHQAEELALALLRHGARVGIVHWATGLKLDVLAGWYRHLHGRAPPRGPLPDSSGSMIRTRTEQVHASLFGVIYTGHHRDGASDRAIDLRGLVCAYELYLALTREATLSINAAWILARDLRAGLASIGWCTACHAPYIALTESILIGCPLCPLYARAAGRSARRPAPMAQGAADGSSPAITARGHRRGFLQGSR